MADDKFEVTWEADDGYVGGSAPHSFHIDADALFDDADEHAMRELFWEEVQSDFESKVHPVSQDEESFIEWAKAKIAAR